jgi:hypothetical protein
MPNGLSGSFGSFCELMHELLTAEAQVCIFSGIIELDQQVLDLGAS